MKRVFFALSFFAAVLNSHSQFDNKKDSLLSELNANKKEDSNKVWTQIRLISTIFYEKPDSALVVASQALATSENIKWQKGLALSYKVFANVYLIKSDYINALDYYHKALGADAGNSKFFEAGILGNIGLVYQNVKQYDSAIMYFKKYISVAGDVNSDVDQAMGLINLATTYKTKGELDTAMHYYERGLFFSEKSGFSRGICNGLNALGVCYKEKKEYAKSALYLQRSLDMADSLGFDYLKAPCLNNLAQVFMAQKDYDKAEKFSKASLELLNTVQDKNTKADVYSTLGQVYENKGNYKMALEYYVAYMSIKDSLMSDSKRDEVLQNQMRYEQEKKEALLNAAHRAEIERQRTIRNFSIAVTFIVLAASLLLFLSYKRRRDAKAKQQEAELKAEITNTEMKALRAQMNPHFIFNSLNSIGAYIAQNNTELAEQYLAKFAKLMRLVLENSEQGEVSLGQDLKALELYIQLESLRLSNKLTYEIKIDESIDTENTLIPPLLLQPFVENSIWHGIAKKEGAGKIIIHIKKENDMISCVIEDNGIGREKAARETNALDKEKRSLGIKITRERISIINKIKKTSAEVKLSDLVQGTRVEVRLPLELNF